MRCVEACAWCGAFGSFFIVLIFVTMNNTYTDERLCCLALTLCPGIGPVLAHRLVKEMGGAVAVFNRREELPALLPGLSKSVVPALDKAEAFRRAEEELNFAEKNRIDCITLLDEAYPSRLRSCEDAPVALFFKGKADLNRLHVVSIVGTRRATEYGRQFCADFLRDLAGLCPDLLVVSGLAYGIDVCAHREALANGLSTVAVLGHGLDRIYPSSHRRTAIDMLENGGLLTEFFSHTQPDRFNFVQRNRIVAGMSDATVVVESAAKGGSLITASLANSYNRDCFAVPGRLGDAYSEGCNRLIHDNKAALLLSGADLVEAMGWDFHRRQAEGGHVQRSLFPELTEEEALVVRVLMERGSLHINTLVVATDIPVNRMSALLFELELKGVVKALVGNEYRLV